MDAALRARDLLPARRACRRPSGFTLVELLVIITILGLLVAVALPRFSGARGKANRATMMSDLRNLVTAEEAYFERNMAYTDNLAQLDYSVSPSVTIEILEVGGNGWSAKATHVNTDYECGVYFGSATPPAGIPIPDEGIIGCT
ncbi:MAG: prepilin-type N-terminal cleavage/methylation domain-containing protein [Gemmatimonadota bacterium]|nr:MAG: prepilin-type N-terminal cleavage/methylation domain-containing protein [Gemmatimonadota bacterium]